MANTHISALSAASAAAAANEIPINEAGASKKLTVAQLQAFLGMTKRVLATQHDSTSTTAAKVTGLDLTAGVGTWMFRYYIRYRTSLSTTSVKFDVNHSGTVTSFVWNQRWSGQSVTAADPQHDQAASVATLMSVFANRAKGTAGFGTNTATDGNNLDMLMIIEGVMVVTVSGNMELWFGSEATGSTQSIMENSFLLLTQVA